MTRKTKNNRSQTAGFKKNYYKKLIIEHKSILAKARNLIGLMLDKLEEEVNRSTGTSESNTENKTNTSTCTNSTNHFLFGDKENASAILTRLTTILLKLIPLEQEIARLDLSKADIMEMEEVLVKTRVPEEDMQIIEEYIQRYNATRE